jgi:hemoglobin-like flavoprotein
MTSNAIGGAPTSSMPLDQEALSIIRFSADRLTNLADQFVQRLHQEILTLSHQAAASMAGEGWPFCERMAQAVLWAALTDEPLRVVTVVLQDVGADNWREGFPDSEYVSVAHALLRTIRGLSDNDWFTAMASAWISYFQWMQPYLLAGARLAAAGPPLAPPPAGGPAPYPLGAVNDAGPAPTVSRDQAPDVELEPVAGLLDDEDDEVGYGQIMLSMTLNSRRDRS